MRKSDKTSVRITNMTDGTSRTVHLASPRETEYYFLGCCHEYDLPAKEKNTKAGGKGYAYKVEII